MVLGRASEPALRGWIKGCVMVTGHKGLCRINVVMPRDLGRALQGDGQLPSLPLSLSDSICGWWHCLERREPWAVSVCYLITRPTATVQWACSIPPWVTCNDNCTREESMTFSSTHPCLKATLSRSARKERWLTSTTASEWWLWASHPPAPSSHYLMSCSWPDQLKSVKSMSDMPGQPRGEVASPRRP